MQLRKVCNHPYMFNGVEPEGADEYGEHLVEACAKLKIVDEIMKKNVKNKEQTLLFSQFTSTLNIIEDYCELRGYEYCRIDGNTDLEDREF